MAILRSLHPGNAESGLCRKLDPATQAVHPLVDVGPLEECPQRICLAVNGKAGWGTLKNTMAQRKHSTGCKVNRMISYDLR